MPKQDGAPLRLVHQLAQPEPVIMMDVAQLEQVLINLVVNARDAMPEGGTLALRTRICRLDDTSLPDLTGGEPVAAGPYVVIEVEDDGAGMPPQVLARIFEPYFSTRREQGGNGLGLATVMGIVRQSDGFVEARSQPGRGSSFRIYLPAVQPGDGAACTPPSPAVASGSTSPRATGLARTVLLVEDETAVRGLAERVLARRGWHVRAAADGHEALRLASAGDLFDLLVTDAAMPGMGGLELIGRLRADRPQLPVILVSGYAEETLNTDLRRDAITFLPKPYSLATLVDLMEALAPARPSAASDVNPLVHTAF